MAKRKNKKKIRNRKRNTPKENVDAEEVISTASEMPPHFTLQIDDISISHKSNFTK